MSNLLQKITKPTQDLILGDLLKEFKDKSFREFLNHLDSIGKLEWFLDTTVSDLIKLKQLKHVTDEKVEDEDDYKDKVLSLLKEVKEGESKRGIKSSQILEKIGGDDKTLRKVLKLLFDEKKAWFTGKTQGMHWILYKYKDKAEAAYRQ